MSEALGQTGTDFMQLRPAAEYWIGELTEHPSATWVQPSGEVWTIGFVGAEVLDTSTGEIRYLAVSSRTGVWPDGEPIRQYGIRELRAGPFVTWHADAEGLAEIGFFSQNRARRRPPDFPAAVSLARLVRDALPISLNEAESLLPPRRSDRLKQYLLEMCLHLGAPYLP
ncbi:MAG TPA: hypothetical protein VKQ34_02695 [Candidatus Saccharimonadales bacterium]|nr:hypothetical protein [Candidatus Saccharimonadales bacterium]